MQGNIDLLYRRLTVATEDSQERIKGRIRVRIQESFAQARFAHGATTEEVDIVLGITKTCYPVPVLEVIAKFSQLTAKSGIEQYIVIRDFKSSDSRIVDGAKANPGVNGRAIRQSVVRRCEWIKRILQRHTDAVKTEWNADSVLKRIGRKRSGRQGRIKKGPGIFKVGKHNQVFVANLAGE